jgi:hypothetical protein
MLIYQIDQKEIILYIIEYKINIKFDHQVYSITYEKIVFYRNLFGVSLLFYE